MKFNVDESLIGRWVYVLWRDWRNSEEVREFKVCAVADSGVVVTHTETSSFWFVSKDRVLGLTIEESQKERKKSRWFNYWNSSSAIQ